MSNLLALIKGKRQEIAAKRLSRNLNTSKPPLGISYLRVFPNPVNPDDVFYQAFGMHFVKTVEAGKEKKVAVLCKSATHDEACELCEGIMEAKAIHKGNKAMDEVISEMRASRRFLMNGTITPTPDITTAEKTELVELPQTVFEDVLKLIEEDMTDEIGEPLSAENGYCFKINRTGSGRDTEYSVSPSRKDGKMAIPAKLMAETHNLLEFANSQFDINKASQVAKAIGAVTGVSIGISSTLSLPATGTDGTAAALPGFSSTTTTTTVAAEAAAEAASVEYKAPETATLPDPEPPVATPTGEAVNQDDLDDMMKELAAL
ncbi:regulator [Providencia hangzhouensis]|uniref:regulator n=1 Tax=Providencia TaxID=586 RepID=UPI00109D03E3|nr:MULTISPECIES: regulator [unclassified Providencia]THB27331.1 regulator [Providencia sp. MGF014]